MYRAVIAAILASVALIAVPAAMADGDPASDVLVGSVLFNPSDSGISLVSQAQLEALLAASAHSGFPVRVALIASPSDLGTATALWNEPGKYAAYLQLELSLLYGGQVLVVMPGGFGLHGPSTGPHAITGAERSVRATAPGPGQQLATAALAAVPLLARAAGHPIPPAALRAAEASAPGTEAPQGPAVPPAALAALLVGAILIAVAWTFSLRARPLRVQRGAR